MILDGELAAGSRIEEVDLATRIGVSRTPVREALIALERDGLVQSRPHRGFTVTPADASLVREAFPVLAALEGAAMRLAWPRLREVASELAELNGKLAAAKARADQYALDHAFHARLTADCGNDRLLELLEIERARARRFDGADRRGTADQAGSCREHAAIIAAIRKDDLAEAASRLQDHWERGIGVVIQWLEQSS
jgi:DNA-binding GntR family transcriptional regulator